MALHQDIFWVGKQWAVTGYGMQAVDQKQKSKFDIEASRLWDENLQESLSDQRWFNADDFNAGLSVARIKYPESPSKAALRKIAAALKGSAPAAVAPSKPPKAEPAKSAPKVEPPKPAAAAPAPAKLAFTGGSTTATIKIDAKARRKVRPAAQLNIRIDGWPAKFTRMWRVRVNAK